MRLVCVIIFLVFVVKVKTENAWLKNIISPKGLDLGYGVALKLNDNRKGKNVPVMERLSLDLNIGDIAFVSLGNPRSDGVELDFYFKKDANLIEEARAKKKDDGGKHMIQMAIGYKAALISSIMFGVMKILTMKAIFLAKAALIISIFVLILKLKNNRPLEIIEVEQHPSHHGPIYEGYGHHPVVDHYGYGGGYYNQHQHVYGQEAQSSNIYPNIAYAPSAGAAEAESNAVYSAVMPNGSVVQAIGTDRNGQETERKKDKSYHRKLKESSTRSNLLSIKKFSPSSEM